jgi:hypothetical protein
MSPGNALRLTPWDVPGTAQTQGEVLKLLLKLDLFWRGLFCASLLLSGVNEGNPQGVPGTYPGSPGFFFWPLDAGEAAEGAGDEGGAKLAPGGGADGRPPAEIPGPPTLLPALEGCAALGACGPPAPWKRAG